MSSDAHLLARIADALERIARVLEQQRYGATAEDVRRARDELDDDYVERVVRGDE